MSEEIFGIMAEYKNPHDIYEAAGKFRDAGYGCSKKWDTYTPFPVHGLEKQMGVGRSHVPWIVLIGGMTGFATGAFITWYMNGYDYPLVVGGKPYWSMIFPFPVLYECTILFSAFGAFFGQFLTNGLPRHHHAVFNSEQFERASDNAFFIVIETAHPLYDEYKTRALLEQTGAFNIHLVSK
jgi:hypothetical protein